MVEALVIRYSDEDKLEKALLASELQTYVRAGKSFEEIQKLSGGVATIIRMGFQELQDTVKDRVPLSLRKELGEGQVIAVWLDDRYMLLRLVTKKASREAEKGFEEMLAGGAF